MSGDELRTADCGLRNGQSGELRSADCGVRSDRSQTHHLPVPVSQSALRIPHSAIWIIAGLIVAIPARAASAYDEVVAPILRARCAECHGEQKQKAKLALHTWETLMHGSEGGPVIVA